MVNDFDDALSIVFQEAGIDGPDLSEEETMEWLHKENIFENLFMKLPRSDLEIISSGDESFIECINEAKMARAMASQNSFKPPVQHRGGQHKRKR